jgi:hypothetical protein
VHAAQAGVLPSAETHAEGSQALAEGRRANDAEARARFRRTLPREVNPPTLRDVQHALALEHGMAGWTALKNQLAKGAPLRRYERVADGLMAAYRTGDSAAMRIVWDYFGHRRVGRH